MKAASTLARRTARVWTRPKLSVKTNMAVYIACVISTLLYGSETWATYAGQESRFNTFHLRSIRRILDISWLDKVTNADVLSRAGLPSMSLCLDNADCEGWVMSAVWMMVAFRNTSSMVNWHFWRRTNRNGHPHLRCKHVCVRDMGCRHRHYVLGGHCS